MSETSRRLYGKRQKELTHAFPLCNHLFINSIYGFDFLNLKLKNLRQMPNFSLEVENISNNEYLT